MAGPAKKSKDSKSKSQSKPAAQRPPKDDLRPPAGETDTQIHGETHSAKGTAQPPSDDGRTVAQRIADSPGARQALVLAVYTLLTLAFLTLPSYQYVFPADKAPRLIGPDAYFHLRHVKAVLADYPMLARPDYRTNFPNGERGLNQGFFDVAIATVVLASGHTITPLVALAWVSPISWVLVGWLGYFWIKRRCGERCASLFLLILALYPGPLNAIAAMGHGDHHAAEVLLAMLVVMSLDWLLSPSTRWQLAPLAVAPLFFFYLSWAGTPLHLLLVGLTFYVRAWMPAEQERDGHLAHKGALYGLTLLAGVLAVGQLAPWAVIWPTSERVFRLAALGLTVGYPLLVWLAARPWERRWLAALGVLGGALLAAYLTPAGGAAINELLAPRTRQIAEHTPVTVPILFGWFGLVWLLALGGPVRLWQRKAFWPSMVPVVYGAGLIFFWVQTRDFNYYAPPILAAAVAYGLGTVPWSRLLSGLLATLVILPLIPGTGLNPWLPRKVVREIILYTDGLEAASEWLKDVQGPARPDKDREYGLIAPWDLGNILAETTETPVGWSQTASDALAKLVYSDQPDQAYQAMTSREKPFRYVLLPARNLGEKFLGEMGAAGLTVGQMFQRGDKVKWKGKTISLLAPTGRNNASLLNRLYWDQGKDLGHFRMVYETPQQVLQVLKILPSGNMEFYAWPVTPESLISLRPLLNDPKTPQETNRGDVVGAKQAAEVRIFEAVPGAVVRGKAPAGTKVVAKLDLFAPTTNRRWTCRWSTTADPSGVFSLRLPYSTNEPLNANPNTIQVNGPYRFDVGGREILLSVREDEVQKGVIATVR